MKLSAKAIITFNGINSFVHGNQWSIRANEPNTLYFQIVDIDQANLRYILGVGGGNQPASINVTFPSLDDTNVITKAAQLVDAADGSIWKIDLASNEVPSSGNVIFALTEGSKTKRFNVLNFISVEYPESQGDC
jgi:hypothetical protein